MTPTLVLEAHRKQGKCCARQNQRIAIDRKHKQVGIQNLLIVRENIRKTPKLRNKNSPITMEVVRKLDGTESK